MKGRWVRALENSPKPELAVIVHRNLGIASYNVLRDKQAAWGHYSQALELAPNDAKLWFEFDQLAARKGDTTAERLARLDLREKVVQKRDDLTVTYALLLAQAGRAGEARALLGNRHFQPWEGGEGQVLAAWDATALALAREALETGHHIRAAELVEGPSRLPQIWAKPATRWPTHPNCT